jgi:hypothetical protein
LFAISGQTVLNVLFPHYGTFTRTEEDAFPVASIVTRARSSGKRLYCSIFVAQVGGGSFGTGCGGNGDDYGKRMERGALSIVVVAGSAAASCCFRLTITGDDYG